MTRCLSSICMTELSAWRNPQGGEESWFIRREPADIDMCCGPRMVVAEIGYALLYAVALVEFCFYAQLAFLSFLVWPCTDIPLNFFAGLLSSASFTTIWSFSNLIFNPCFPNLFTRESFARSWADNLNPTCIRLDCNEDYLERVELERQVWRAVARPVSPINEPQLDPQPEPEENSTVAAGGLFIVQNVIPGLATDIVEAFKDQMAEYDIYQFIVTKAIFHFLINKEITLPAFFQKSTNDVIVNARVGYDRAVLEEVSAVINNPLADLEILSADARDLLIGLRSVASEETQGGIFSSRCWNVAIRFLNRSNPS